MFTGIRLGSQSDVNYNGVQFTELIKSDVKISPIYNNQGTAIKCNKYVFKFTAIVTPQTAVPNTGNGDDTTDGKLRSLRELLLVNGRQFRYNDKGLGNDLTVDTNSAKYDVQFGPKPTLLAFEPIGNNKTVRIVFEIELHLTDCDEGTSPQPTGISEFWYSYKLAINQSGYRTMQRKGYIEIIDRRSSELVSGTHLVDEYQNILTNMITGEEMEQFHFEQDYDFADNGLSCTFNHTFTEIESPNAYPNGVVSIDAKQRTASKLLSGDTFQSGFNTWTNSIDMSITLRPGIPKVTAWIIFTVIAQQRIQESIAQNIDNNQNGQPLAVVRIPIVLSIEIEEDIFGHGASFSIVWVSFADSLQNVLTNAGVFKAVENTDWQDWHADIRSAVQNYTGQQNQINFNASNRVIISPCNQDGSSIEGTLSQTNAEQLSALFNPSCPPPESSYLDYQNTFRVLPRIGRKVHRRYRQEAEIERQEPETANFSEQFSVAKSYNRLTNETDYFVQDTGNDVMKVQMRGYSIRVGRPTRPPEVSLFGGREVRIIDDSQDRIGSRVISANSNCPVFLSQWVVTFEVLGSIVDENVEYARTTNGEPGAHN